MQTELIDPAFLKDLFGEPVSNPPAEREDATGEELIDPQFLRHLFGR